MKAEELQDLDIKRREIDEILRAESLPLLTELSHVGSIYRLCEKNLYRSEKKSLFLFVVLMLYAPAKLIIGTKIRKPLMRELCRITGCSQSLISHRCENLLLKYRTYYFFNDLAQELINDTRNMLINELGMNATNIDKYVKKWTTGYGEE